MPDNQYALIMAGGRGTRFWPRSRKRNAKQVLNVLGERTLIQQTVERLAPFIPPERQWVITNEYLRDKIVRQCPEIPKRQILAEPAQRNTAPCIALAAHIFHSIDPDAVMGVFPADQVIFKPARFRRLLRAAFREAARGGLVVMGIQPRWAETGYGYVEFEEAVKPGELKAFSVLSFREKPDSGTAEQFVAAGRFFWNSGMFFWKASTFLDALRKHQPKSASILAALPPFRNPRFASRLREAYPLCENVSVDYAIMEKADNVAGIAADDIGWNDVGSWNAVYELLPRDENGNAVRGDSLIEESHRNYVDAGGKLVALLGVEDLVIVDTPDALLVAARSRAQQVGNLVKALEKRKREDLL